MSMCQQVLRGQGKAYPRTCARCGLFGGCALSFAEKFKALAGDRDELELANMFKVSKPTIRRWKCGTTQPAPLAQPIVIATFAKEHA